MSELQYAIDWYTPIVHLRISTSELHVVIQWGPNNQAIAEALSGIPKGIFPKGHPKFNEIVSQLRAIEPARLKSLSSFVGVPGDVSEKCSVATAEEDRTGNGTCGKPKVTFVPEAIVKGADIKRSPYG